MHVDAVNYRDGAVEIIDQTLLPHELFVLRIRDLETLCEAIRSLRVRGAPAIGVAAAYGLRMVAEGYVRDGGDDAGTLRRELQAAAAMLAATRPTARNLFGALERMRRVAHQVESLDALIEELVRESDAVHAEDRAACAAIGHHGAALLPPRASILTHCNAGALATGGIGTALGVVYAAAALGKDVHVYADETRPLLQGARLTTWELERAGIKTTLLCDNAAAALLARGAIDCAIVGADRIARNGDTANKVGTLGVALAAHRFGVPFYVAAPSSTFDLSLASGAEIPIEERAPQEVARGFGVAIAPAGVGVFNPAFDVTPADLITAIVHEGGVIRPPFELTVPASLATIRPTG
jgi:methylthioribose-1-phosphate isomerase